MQVSSKKMTAQHSQEMLNQLHEVLASLNSPDEVAVFLRDILTHTEQTVWAKRLAIAEMLAEQKSYAEIRQKLKVSSATISSVNELLDTDGLQLALDHLRADDWAEGLLAKWMPNKSK